MNIFRKLRWKLTLNYTIVTVSAFLVVLVIMGGLILPRIFIPINILTPEGIIRILQSESIPLLSHILSQSPVDTQLLRYIYQESGGNITNFELLRVGSLQFSVNTIAMIRTLVVGADGTILGMSQMGFPNLYVGDKFDPTQFNDLEVPYKAALAGETNPENMYTVYEPNRRFALAVPVINYTGPGENNVVGVWVLFVDTFPTQEIVPSQILNIAGRSLLVFLFGIGIIGTLFGAFFARGLAERFKRLSTTIDGWSEGDFSRFIVDTSEDEITQLAQRLNNMAKQLQELMRRRQEMAVSEERNRLARDLHDSAKQQALAASFQLGTALTLYESDPQDAKKHLEEADALVDAVRKELTNLVHELRPQALDKQDFSEILKEYTFDWSQRSKIEAIVNIEGSDNLSLENREALFRIIQEALANIARHSSAGRVELSLKIEANTATMIIQDNGKGFDVNAPHSGLGLSSMRERTEALGGSFSMKSGLDQGTEIVVTFPNHG
jgi:NarL family two-component system sensor histidine kinase LiaS